jgi:hypothetical protein
VVGVILYVAGQDRPQAAVKKVHRRRQSRNNRLVRQ